MKSPALFHRLTLERRGRFSWWLVGHSEEGFGVDLETGPFFTKAGARWHRRVWG